MKEVFDTEAKGNSEMGYHLLFMAETINQDTNKENNC